MSSFLTSYIQIFALLKCMELLNEKRIKHNWLYALGISIIGEWALKFSQIGGVFVVAFLLIGVMQKQKESVVKSVAMPLFSMLSGLISMVSIVSVIQTFHLIEDLSNMNGIVSQLINIMCCLLAYLFLWIVKKIAVIKRMIVYGVFDGMYAKLGIVITLIGFAVIYFFALTEPFGKNAKMLDATFFAFLVILFAVVLGLLALGAVNHHQKIQKEFELEQLRNYTDRIEMLYKDIRAFKHDYVNILASIMGYVENADIEGLEKHFKEFVVPYSKQLIGENESLGALTNIKVTPLKGILTTKIVEIYKHKLTHSIEVVDPIERIDMDIIDLCRMVGILLDNAIEAAHDSVDKVVDVAIIQGHEGVSIIVTNSLPNDVMPIHKMYQEGISSKGQSRGLGLYNYKKIAQRHENVLTETEIENGHFRQILRVNSVC